MQNDGLGGGTATFACFTPADRERVWATLTDAGRTGAFLYGLAAHSS